MYFTTLIALTYSHLEWGNSQQSIQYAKNIFVAVPLSLLFLLAQKLNIGFWTCYSSGIVLLGVGYFVHSYLFKLVL